MPNRTFNVMPMIKFSTNSVTMAGKAKTESSCKGKCILNSAGENDSFVNVVVDAKDALRHMCEYCGYRTRIPGNLRIHKRRHTGEKPFCCALCNATFVSRYQLTTHEERHTNDQQRRSRHICKDCNLGFLSARALYHHKPLHADVKQYKCTMCEKSYAQAAGYAQHKRWHRQQNERATATVLPEETSDLN